MAITAVDVVVAAFGASGRGVALAKVVTDLRDDQRKARDDARKEREDARKAREERSKLADQIAPFLRELNDGDYLYLFGHIKKNSSPKPEEDKNLMDYPSKLEEIGALMLAGKFSRQEVFDHFGEEILITNDAEFLWKGEDLHYWKVFQLLVDEMKRERIYRERLVKPH